MNAWYARPALTICYEYLEEFRRDRPAATTADAVTPVDGEIGQLFYAVAHEMGHASFDLFNTPVVWTPGRRRGASAPPNRGGRLLLQEIPAAPHGDGAA